MILLEIIILPSNTVLRNPTSEIYLINESDFFLIVLIVTMHFSDFTIVFFLA